MLLQTRISVLLWTRICLIIILPIVFVVSLGQYLSLVSLAQTPEPSDFTHWAYLPFILKSSSSPPVTPQPTPVPTMTLRITNTVAFIVEQDGYSLWIANLDGSGEKKILAEVSGFLPSNEEWKNRVGWSPDGQRLAVNRFGGLWILSPDGDNLTEVVPLNWNQGKDITNFAWSPSGTKIAFLQRAETSTYYLGIVELATGKVSYLVDNPPRAEDRLSWSPDSQWIALAEQDKLSLVKTTNGAISPLEYACQGGNILTFSWSPQSDQLLVWDVGNGRYAHGESCLMRLDEQVTNLGVGGNSGKPFWAADGGQLYVSATNFDPDNPNLEKDSRILLFDKAGRLIKRLNLVTSVGDLPEISTDRRQFLSWLPDEQNWFKGYIQVASLSETEISSKKVRVPNMIGWLANADDRNASYIWAADSRNGIFLSVTDLIYTVDLRYGSVYAFDGQTNNLKRITNDHKIKFIAASPRIE